MIFEEKHAQSRSNVDLLPDHIFTPAMNNIRALMENDSYARFLQSPAGKPLQPPPPPPPPPPNTTTTTPPLVSSGEDEHVTSSEEEHGPHTKHELHPTHPTHPSSNMLRRAFSTYTNEEKKKQQKPPAADGHGQDHTSSSTTTTTAASSTTHHATSSSLFRRARKMVSLKKRRYKQDGFDLDLSYVTERVIAMGFPSQGMQGLYRNPRGEVVKFFNQYHHGHYRIYNLCNERDYSCDTFGKEDGSNVKRYPFEDHNPCALHVMYEFCHQVESYLKEDPDHVVAIHCKAGKGRTGLLISALLVHQGLSSSFALRLYAERRTKNNKGLTIPSQRRYVQYYSKYIQCPEYYNRLSAIPR
jgi:protein-tyrosine phosphatase